MNMKRRVESDSDVQLKKCAKRSFVGDDGDRMSQLPDEVLVDILSWLSVNEAARTSVLSRRWRNLWKHIPSLNFDAQSALRNNLKNSRMRGKLIKSEGSKYVKWVNSVLQSHKSLTLKEFIIGFALDITAKHSINLWLHFAFARQVQRLELDFMCYCNPPSYYCFPEEFLPLSNCISPKLQTPSDIFWNHRPLMLDNFKSLKDLSFKSVNLSGEVIEFFLHNCRLLERLVVHRSHKISNLKVCGPSLRLKHLEIVHCFGLKTLKVSLPNLTSLRVKIVDELVLENVPMLVELSFSCNDIGMSVKGLMSAVSCCISQLEILRLELYTSKEINEIYKFPEIPKLKKLFILFDGDGFENLFRMTAFIKASPSLEDLN